GSATKRSAANSKNSLITTSARDPFGLTGTGRGGPGAARPSNLPSVIAALRRGDPEKIERAVLVSLPPSLTSSLAARRPATGDLRTTHSLTGYLITTALPPETIAEAPPEFLPSARAHTRGLALGAKAATARSPRRPSLPRDEQHGIDHDKRDREVAGGSR